MSLVVEATGQCDLRDRIGGGGKTVARMLDAFSMTPPMRTVTERHLEGTGEVATRQLARSRQPGDRQRRVQARQRQFMHEANLPHGQAGCRCTDRGGIHGAAMNLQRLRYVVRTGSSIHRVDIVELSKRMMQQLHNRTRRPASSAAGKRGQGHIGSHHWMLSPHRRRVTPYTGGDLFTVPGAPGFGGYTPGAPEPSAWHACRHPGPDR